MTTEQKTFTTKSRFVKPDPTNNKTRGYKYRWDVYPDYWKESWGPKPLLGTVRADSAFHARYAAYDKRLLTYNFTFGPEVVKQPYKAVIRKPADEAVQVKDKT